MHTAANHEDNNHSVTRTKNTDSRDSAILDRLAGSLQEVEPS